MTTRQQYTGYHRLINVVIAFHARTLLVHLLAMAGVMGLPFRGFAVLAPTTPLCASVAPNGQVTITWAPPADPMGEFDHYEVHRSTASGGPFTPIADLPGLATTTYTDATADGTAGPVFYFITTVTNGTPPETSAPGDTISTIYLQVFQSTPLGYADLSWNHIAVPPSAEDSFQVWMEYPVGTWQQIATVPGNRFSYQHEISICEDVLTFQIRRAGLGCTSSSNLAADVFRDVTPPSIPMMSTVTVDTSATGNGRTTVTWVPSPEADTDGYIIVYNASGGAVIVDTVWGGASSTYEWEDSTPGLGPESFAVAAFDTCMTGDPPSPNTSATQPFHTTVHLNHTYDPCSGRIDLVWSSYVGWAVVQYTVHMRTSTGAWSSIAVQDGSTTSASVTVDPFITYEFVVVASQGAGLLESISNRISVYADHPGLPAFNYLRSVTVSDEFEITVVDSLDVLAQVTGYRLERSVDGGPFEELSVIGAIASNTFTYVDTDVEPATRSYRYRVVVLDDCGQDALTSNIGGNILLKVTPDLYGGNTLSWNGYQEWAGGIAGYRVLRQVGSGPEELLTVAPALPWNLVDDVGTFTASTGLFCYTLVAMESGNPSGMDAVSQSNRACAVQQDLVYIPNAFVLGGVNTVFKPELAYTDVTIYELSIINRWGQVFWTTNDPQEGWDGTSGGRPVPLGVYAYYCKYRNGAGREFERRGTVTMLTAMD